MQKRIHRKNHNSKTNPKDLKIIYAHLNSKQYDRRITRPNKWFEKYVNKAKALISKMKGVNDNASGDVQNA